MIGPNPSSVLSLTRCRSPDATWAGLVSHKNSYWNHETLLFTPLFPWTKPDPWYHMALEVPWGHWQEHIWLLTQGLHWKHTVQSVFLCISANGVLFSVMYVCLHIVLFWLPWVLYCGLSENCHVLWDHTYTHTHAKKKKESNTVGTGVLICCTLRNKRK